MLRKCQKAMRKEIYDTMIIGPISLDIMIDCRDNEQHLVGGASVQSGYAASNIGARTGDRRRRLHPYGTNISQRIRRPANAGCCPAVIRSRSETFLLSQPACISLRGWSWEIFRMIFSGKPLLTVKSLLMCSVFCAAVKKTVPCPPATGRKNSATCRTLII